MKKLFYKITSGLVTTCMTACFLITPVIAEPEYSETEYEAVEAEAAEIDAIEADTAEVEIGSEDTYNSENELEELYFEEIIETGCIEDEDYPDNDELLAGYFDKEVFGDYGISTYSIGTRGLTKGSLKLYNAMKPKIEKIAAGELASSEFVFTAEELGLSDLTPDDCNVSSFTRENIGSCVSTYGGLSLDEVVSYLLVNMPYDLYWFDKTGAGGWVSSISFGSNSIYSYKVFLYVDLGYGILNSPTDKKTTTIDTAKTSIAISSANNAKNIALEISNSGMSDYERLKAYKERICSLTDYDHDAVLDDYSGDKNPWQLIHVFDNDPSTKVVCEGYSKAFQYLCDLDGNLECYIVAGYMGGGTGAGRHMWNIVSLDGNNYLADITNSDSGSVGQNGKLFMAGKGKETSVSGSSEFESTAYSYDSVWYSYAIKYREMYGSILDLADKAYSAEQKSDYVISGSTITGYSGADEEVVIPERINGIDITEIGNRAFSNNTTLKSVIIPEAISSIGQEAFSGCSQLTSIRIPNKETYIASNAIPYSSELVIYGYANSSAHTYARTNGIKFLDIDTGVEPAIEVESIEISNAPESIFKDDKIQLECIFTPADATNKNITWKSNAPKIAAIDQTGLLEALDEGKTTITATTDNGKKATCVIEVKIKEPEEIPVIIKVDAPEFSISNGSTVESGVEVIITTRTEGADIYYTTDGSAPGKNSTKLGADGKYKILESITIKAIAVKDEENFENSEITTASYIVKTSSEDPETPDDDDEVLPEDKKDQPEDLSTNPFWITGIKSDGYNYTGAAIKPDINVYFKNKKLLPNIDYSVSYKNNVKAGSTASLTVKGKGKYSVSKTLLFTINPIDLSKDVKLVATAFPAKTSYTPIIALKVDNTVLKAGTDYTLTYCADAEGEIMIKQPKTVSPNPYYIKIMAKGNNCTESRIFPFNISGENTPISKAKITVLPISYGEKSPKITVKYDNETLKENEQYVLSSPINIDKKGTGTIYIYGMGSFSGSVKKTFKVNALSLEDAEISINGTKSTLNPDPAVKVNYEKGGAKPTVSVSLNQVKLTEGIDYSVTYSGNTKIGTALVTVKGKGNYSGTVKANFKVIQGNICDWKVFVSDVAKPAKDGKVPAKPTVLVYDKNDKKLAVNSDYKVTYIGDDKETYTGYKIKLEPGKNSLYKLGDGKSEIPEPFKSGFEYKVMDKSKLITGVSLIAKDSKGDKYSDNAPRYDGEKKKLDTKWIKVVIGKTPLSSDCYVIEEDAYINSVNKGTASVVIKGNPEKGYGGMKVLNFNIGAYVDK